MRGLRGRCLFALIMFFAGFATAIYMLAPAPDGPGSYQAGTEYRDVEVGSKNEQFAMKFNVGMRKCLSFAEDKAVELSEVVKTKLAERQLGIEK